MRFIDVFRMALGNLRRNKMRTVLTVSGVVVGIGAIVFLVSLGFGLQALLVNKVANLEALTVITVRPGNKEDTVLTDSTVSKFKSYGEVVAVSPVLSYPAQIQNGKSSVETVIYGVNPEHLIFEDIKVSSGKKELTPNSNEAIVSVASLKASNLESKDVLEKEFPVRVIQVDKGGKMKEDSAASTIKIKIVGISSEEKIKFAYMPLSLLQSIDGKEYSSVKVKVAQRKQVTNVRKSIESMGLPTTSVKDTVDQIDQAFVIVKSVLAGFGLIALFVAAIGIFNTMTISLLERTHEIGIMKAIGGRNVDIAKMFIVEAAMIGFLGGAFGVFAGWGLGGLINGLVNFVAVSVGGESNSYFLTPIDFVGITIAFSLVVSTFAGVWPAKRASKLNPLEALRYE